jgi:hypothetical protein
MSIDKAMLRGQIADLIGDDQELATFRGVPGIILRRTEAFQQRAILSAGFSENAANLELYMTDENVAGQGIPQADEDIILADGTYEIIGVRPSPAQAFFTLTMRKANR